MKHAASFLLALLLARSAALAGPPPEIPVLPRETGLFRPGPGAGLANAQCLACHSVEYVATQPHLPRAFWKGSIEKMRAKFGASIPDDQTAPLLDYLVSTYGKPDPATNAPTLHPTPGTNTESPQPGALQPSPSGAARALMLRGGCFNCHQVDAKLVGPPFRAVAAKYASERDGAVRVMEQIKNGGAGKWGPIPMPPAPGFSPDETALIARWILDQK